MKRSIFPLKSFCLLSILTLITLSITAQKKGTIAYSKKINGNDVVICPINKVTETVKIKLSSLVESCEIIKLETSPDAFFNEGFHTEISDKYICIKSYARMPAKLFNKNGKFLRDIGSIGNSNYFELTNDFFGNINATPVFSNGYFINNVAAITLKKQIEEALKRKDLSEKERQKLVEFNKNLKQDDNNIIFYGKLKKQ